MKTDKSPDSLFGTLHEEAHARIIWGESADEVKRWLGEQGLTEGQAGALVKASLKERYLEVRKSGMRMIFSGSVMLVGGVGLILVMWFVIRFIITWLAAIALMVALYGLSRLISGIWQLLAGRARGSVANLD